MSLEQLIALEHREGSSQNQCRPGRGFRSQHAEDAICQRQSKLSTDKNVNSILKDAREHQLITLKSEKAMLILSLYPAFST